MRGIPAKSAFATPLKSRVIAGLAFTMSMEIVGRRAVVRHGASGGRRLI
jgi:hypothetical protein